MVAATPQDRRDPARLAHTIKLCINMLIFFLFLSGMVAAIKPN